MNEKALEAAANVIEILRDTSNASGVIARAALASLGLEVEGE